MFNNTAGFNYILHQFQATLFTSQNIGVTAISYLFKVAHIKILDKSTPYRNLLYSLFILRFIISLYWEGLMFY